MFSDSTVAAALSFDLVEDLIECEPEELLRAVEEVRLALIDPNRPRQGEVA
jgi:hypothetical protein